MKLHSRIRVGKEFVTRHKSDGTAALARWDATKGAQIALGGRWVACDPHEFDFFVETSNQHRSEAIPNVATPGPHTGALRQPKQNHALAHLMPMSLIPANVNDAAFWPMPAQSAPTPTTFAPVPPVSAAPWMQPTALTPEFAQQMFDLQLPVQPLDMTFSPVHHSTFKHLPLFAPELSGLPLSEVQYEPQHLAPEFFPQSGTPFMPLQASDFAQSTQRFDVDFFPTQDFDPTSFVRHSFQDASTFGMTHAAPTLPFVASAPASDVAVAPLRASSPQQVELPATQQTPASVRRVGPEGRTASTVRRLTGYAASMGARTPGQKLGEWIIGNGSIRDFVRHTGISRRALTRALRDQVPTASDGAAIFRATGIQMRPPL